LTHCQEKILAEKAERQNEIDRRRKERKAEELDTQPYISEPWGWRLACWDNFVII
jgi:hypothetical protein